MKDQLAVLPAVLLVAVLLVAAGGCDLNIPGGANPGETDLPSQTKILRVEVRPSPVSAGDTARFTCVIEDSTDTGFIFNWSFGAGSPNGADTEGPTVEWVAPKEPGTYTNAVRVDDGSTDTVSPTKSFSVTVVEP